MAEAASIDPPVKEAGSLAVKAVTRPALIVAITEDVQMIGLPQLQLKEVCIL